MRTFALALASVAAIAIAAPAGTTPANADTVKKVIIKRDGDRGHHYGWRNRDRDRSRVVIKHRGSDNVGFRDRHEGTTKKVIIKKRGGHDHDDD